MAYTPDYTESDMSASIIDTVVKVLILFGTFATLIVLIMLFVWVKKKIK
jgi:hypothetical protein